MINAAHVSKKFGKLQALRDINLTCSKGQSIALIGPNGSGKTTFIKCLLGMVVPDSGTIQFHGKNIANEWEYRSKIGYMPQIGRFPDNMTIAQVVDMLKDIRKKDASATDEDLIHAFQLDRIMNKRMHTLSGGTRQKVSACLAFLFGPEVLILDEPTAGLDPLASELLKDKIRAVREKGKLILITSHVLSELDDIVSEVIYLEDGCLKFHKNMEQLKLDTGEDRLAGAIARVMRSTEKR
ncbi:MAG: ABC transporter ATP-binding protein [Bacteroidota bacterium]|nr:ABC transporter ATP-binding protein [Bacteroidota bacterium]MDP4216565.1 ABC transporter ATP-binding protein [Bacteroidota bacterium]MDP4245029.1 ABC transporter ATP-binding protein [Bacteroidota bacterium]MDP4252864.1 ABC transporter ATP-binding protein [Bacteroidota bacterium]MDP4259856.1 ABC transporter ATP-binding protein [Bacteroidota bacterium]